MNWMLAGKARRLVGEEGVAAPPPAPPPCAEPRHSGKLLSRRSFALQTSTVHFTVHFTENFLKTSVKCWILKGNGTYLGYLVFWSGLQPYIRLYYQAADWTYIATQLR